jgi:DNA-binding NtrC family response regulator
MICPVRTLCVDDDFDVLNALEELLLCAGHQVFATTSVKEALMLLETEAPFNFCISDYQMPEMLGDDFLRHVASSSPETVRVLMSGYIQAHFSHPSNNESVFNAFLEKPFRLPELFKILGTPQYIRP